MTDRRAFTQEHDAVLLPLPLLVDLCHISVCHRLPDRALTTIHGGRCSRPAGHCVHERNRKRPSEHCHALCLFAIFEFSFCFAETENDLKFQKEWI